MNQLNLKCKSYGEERRILPRKSEWTDSPEPERTRIAHWTSVWANYIANDGLCALYTSLISWYHISPRERSGEISELTQGFFIMSQNKN